MSAAGVFRGLKSIHGWMGVIVMPWVIGIGRTGFYLNHPDPFLRLLDVAEIDDTAFPGAAAAVDLDYLAAFVGKQWPDAAIIDVSEVVYHDQPALLGKTDAREVIALIRSGYVFSKTDYVRRVYKPDGGLIHTKYYWGRIFKEFHVKGWWGQLFGTWLADAASLCMVGFGLTGLYLFLWPRLPRRGRMRQDKPAGPTRGLSEGTPSP